MRQLIKENNTLRRLYYWLRLLRFNSQSNECAILSELTKHAPRTFIEFGFHPAEFNCIGLAKDPEWSGLLVDGNERQVEDAHALWPSRIETVKKFLTLENLDFIRARFSKLGVLSIDVDGNDYWFLKALIGMSPSVICVEYNSTFGLEPITVPYDAGFDRHLKHPRGWFHGASLPLFRNCASSTATGSPQYLKRGPMHSLPAMANWTPAAPGNPTGFASSSPAFPTTSNGTRSSTCPLWPFSSQHQLAQYP